MAFATPRNLSNLTSSTLDWLQRKPKSPKSRNSCIRYRGRKPLFISCSTKPNKDKDNGNYRNDDVGSSSNSRIHDQTTSSGTNPALLSPSYTKGLIFDLGCKDSWDSAEIGSPVVKRFLSDEEERWFMWYRGSPNESPSKYSIGLAVSRNGVYWERGREGVRSNADVGLVMNCSTDWWAFDTQSVMPNEVVIMSSSKLKPNNALYWLYYTGFGSEKIDRIENMVKVRTHIGSNGVLKSLPGLAMSQDGRHWARIEGDHHSGALFDVGSNGEWDSTFIASTRVVFHGSNDLRMYYHSFDEQQTHFAIGIARSKDGIQWTKLGKILGKGAKGTFDELGVMNPQVVKDKKLGRYLMVYEGVDANGVKSIGLAVSSNGLNDWTRFRECPLMKKSANGWDCEGVGSPYLVQMDDKDKWRLYCEGTGKDGKTRIGLAVSQGTKRLLDPGDKAAHFIFANIESMEPPQDHIKANPPDSRELAASEDNVNEVYGLNPLFEVYR